MLHGLSGLATCILLLSFAQASQCFIGGNVGFRGFNLPALRRGPCGSRGVCLRGPRMQVENFGDSPSDVLKWTRERETVKAEKGAKVTGKSLGEWDSPISSKMVGEDTVMLGSPLWDGTDLYWLEDRPLEGRQVIVRRSEDGETRTVSPDGAAWDVGSHEGAPYTVKGGVAYFNNRADGRLYTQVAIFPAEPVALTPEGGDGMFSDLSVDKGRDRILCLRRDSKTASALVAVSLQDTGEEPAQPTVLYTTDAVLSSARLSSDAQRVAWVLWQGPAGRSNSEVWAADVGDGGELSGVTKVAAAATQPQWSALGLLYYLSDQQGRWNVYEEGRADPLAPILPEEEVAAGDGSGDVPYVVQMDGTILSVLTKGGGLGDRLCRIDPLSGTIEQVDSPFVTIRGLAISEGELCVVGSRRRAACSISMQKGPGTEWSDIKPANENKVRVIYASEPRALDFSGVAGLPGRALLYPPKNDRYQVELGDAPPLIIFTSGGERERSAGLGGQELDMWYWTSRGYAVMLLPWASGKDERTAINKASPKQMALHIQAAARHLTSSGEADADRVVVVGSDRGGAIAAHCLGADSLITAGACVNAVLEASSGTKIQKPFAAVHGGKGSGVTAAKDLYESAKKEGVLCLSAIAPREASPFRTAAGKVLALDALLIFVARALRLESTFPADYSDLIEIGNYDPLTPGEARSYIVIDGWELEVGRESFEIREVGYENPGNAAYFPEERPDRPSGSDPDDDTEETPYMDQIEWL